MATGFDPKSYWEKRLTANYNLRGVGDRRFGHTYNGWLYRVRGAPDKTATDVNGYIAVLDATVDKMIAARHTLEGNSPPGVP